MFFPCLSVPGGTAEMPSSLRKYEKCLPARKHGVAQILLVLGNGLAQVGFPLVLPSRGLWFSQSVNKVIIIEKGEGGNDAELGEEGEYPLPTFIAGQYGSPLPRARSQAVGEH